jgi:alpha-mannosidase
VALDDGIYPDAEQSKVQWEGCDGTVIHAMTRIPLAADSALSYLRFCLRMAESMEEDQIAAITFARWPEVESPWLQDLRAVDKYAPVLGRFVSFDDFIDQTETPGRLSSYQEREYLSPFLVQAVAREEWDPISRFVRHYRRRFEFDASLWLQSATEAVLGGDVSGAHELQKRIEGNGSDPLEDDPELDDRLQDFRDQAVHKFSEIALQQDTDQPGCLVLNPLSHKRRVVVEFDGSQGTPVVAGGVKAVQELSGKSLALVEVPPCGFAWFGLSSKPAGLPVGNKVDRTPSTVQDHVLRNEFFEVHINETTGGIQQIKEYGRRPNRLSQQLSFRFVSERVVSPPRDGEPALKSIYAQTCCETVQVTCSGPGLGEIVTKGAIIDQVHGERLAGFQQRMRLWRGSPFLELQIQLDIESSPEGSPWATYFASRFAWNDSTASLTRSVLEGAHSVGSERFESPHFLELAIDEQRTTIFGKGLPFYRKTGPRRVDAILVAGKERCRTFDFVIGVDRQFPMQSAVEMLHPAMTLATQNRKPREPNSGWLFQVRESNVLLTQILPCPTAIATRDTADEFAPDAPDFDSSQCPQSDNEGRSAVMVRLVESEGRNRRVHLNCFRIPALARQRDLQGRVLSELAIEDGQVVLEMTAFEIADVELCFEK